MSFKEPNTEELAGVQRLRERLAAAQPPITHNFGNTALLRFYRGRKGVDNDAFNAVAKHDKWRTENDVDNIAQHVHMFQKEMSAGKFVVEGYDNTGRPAIFIYAAKHSKYDRNLDETRLLIIYTMETILRRAKPNEERILICFDLTGFKLSCMDYDLVKLLIRILEFNYPETLSSSLIINAPFVFYACWAVIRPWLDPVTAAKVAFIHSDQLAEHISFSVKPSPVRCSSDRSDSRDRDIGRRDSLSSSDTSTAIATILAKGDRSPAEVNAEFESLFNQQLSPDNPHRAAAGACPSKQKKKAWFW